mmetsp:Transcript_19260/g.41925  ORF Transcript_19260/g.41925 Transcript_19260/m.41925 type:complete len:85 (+) Transcript_19260:880-1134(+)
MSRESNRLCPPNRDGARTYDDEGRLWDRPRDGGIGSGLVERVLPSAMLDRTGAFMGCALFSLVSLCILIAEEDIATGAVGATTS